MVYSDPTTMCRIFGPCFLGGGWEISVHHVYCWISFAADNLYLSTLASVISWWKNEKQLSRKLDHFTAFSLLWLCSCLLNKEVDSFPDLCLSKFVNQMKICSLPGSSVIVPVGDYVDCGRRRELFLCIKPWQEESSLLTLPTQLFFIHFSSSGFQFHSGCWFGLLYVCLVGGVNSNFPGHWNIELECCRGSLAASVPNLCLDLLCKHSQPVFELRLSWTALVAARFEVPWGLQHTC